MEATPIVLHAEIHEVLMLYDAYEVQRSLLAGASRLAGLGAGWMGNPANWMSYSSWPRLARRGTFRAASAPAESPH